MGHVVFVETTGLGVQAMEYAKRSGHTVTLLWSPAYEFTAPGPTRDHAREVADHVARLDDIHDLDATVAALRACAPVGVDAVLSTLSYCTPAAAALAEAVGARGTPLAAVAAAGDKGRCREVLRAAGVASLEFRVVANEDEAVLAAEAIGFPAIIKPVFGIGKALTAIVRSAQDVRAHFAQEQAMLDALEGGIVATLDSRYIVEEYATGTMYSVELAADGQRFVPLVAVRRKRALDNSVLELGCTVPTGLSATAEADLGEYAASVCRALGLNLGIFHVEIMLTPDGFRLIEANPRMTGGSLPDTINTVADADIFAILIDLFAGSSVSLGPLRLAGAASHSFLAAAHDARLPADLPDDWFGEFRPSMHSGWMHAAPGDVVRRMSGNFDSFGMIRATAADGPAAEAACARVKQAVGTRLGFALLADETESLLVTVPPVSA